jgi:hypothetical protein
MAMPYRDGSNFPVMPEKVGITFRKGQLRKLADFRDNQLLGDFSPIL